MKTYREISEHYGLKGITADLYVAYMLKRWANTEEQKCQDGYAQEWAERFLTNRKGLLEATKKHLEDMRRLVFRKKL